MTEPPNTTDPPRRKRQFTIAQILFATTLVAIAAAGFSGLLRADREDMPLAFILFIIAAPLGFMLFMSLLAVFTRLVEKRRQRYLNREEE